MTGSAPGVGRKKVIRSAAVGVIVGMVGGSEAEAGATVGRSSGASGVGVDDVHPEIKSMIINKAEKDSPRRNDIVTEGQGREVSFGLAKREILRGHNPFFAFFAPSRFISEFILPGALMAWKLG